MDQEFGAFQPKKVKSSKFSKKKLFIPLVVLGIALIGFTVVLATRIWDPLWNPFRPSPETVLLKAFQTIESVNSYRFNLESKGDFILGLLEDKRGREILSTDRKQEISLELQAEGKMDYFDKENPKTETDFSFSIYAGVLGFPFSFKAITLGEVSYYKIEKIPLSGLLEVFLEGGGGDILSPQEEPSMAFFEQFFVRLIQQMKDKWIRVDPEEIEEEFGISIKEITKEEKAKLKAKFQELLLQYPPIFLEKEFKDEIIDGKKCYHYLLRPDKENIKTFLKKWLDFLDKEGIASGGIVSFLTQTDLSKTKEEISTGIEELFEAIKFFHLEIWIDKKTYYVYKISFDIDIEDEKDKMNLDGRILFSDYNQKFQISPPEESVSLMEFIGQIFGALFPKQLLFQPSQI